MKRIYLDHSATTPVDSEVLAAMTPYFSDKFGNASSVHSFGQEARSAVDNARHQIAEFLNCKSIEVIFTSGGSESDNLAIKGVVEAVIPDLVGDQLIVDSRLRGNDKKNGNDKNTLPHVITSAFEHHAVLETVKELERDGKIEATFIKPNKEGLIEVRDIETAIKNHTILVSIMYVNNEIGTVQPIRAIGQAIEKLNKNREQKIYFHTDTVQAAEYFDMNVDTLHVDLLTMSAHKIYGPKGIGLLYIRSGVPIKHQIIGGGQEYKKRAGTENVASIVGFAKAVEMICHPELVSGSNKNEIPDQVRNDKTKVLRDKLISGLLQIPNSFLNGSRELRSPANANISFINAEGEAILLNLDMEGIAASTGSACTSGSLSPSHVLLSLGLKPEQCHGSIRFTLGRETIEEEIDKVLEVMPGIIEKLRKMSPFS
ncbi:MAG: aminotransferase class V-fold PLP-dependent enzyme [Candidatus Berkelbacteria bacterium]|nr:aminotransferase class V-fold PLP-dependent enzyme [Candidatus Berkelbacteria bacterium]